MDELKIISLNIELNKHLDLIIPFFKKENVDVLLLQEVFKEDLEFLKNSLGMEYVFAPLAKIRLPEGTKTMGIVTFSRDKIKKSKTSYFNVNGTHDQIPFCDRPDPEETSRAILITWIKRNSQEFCLVNTHFTWAPDGGPNLRQRVDLEKLLKLLSPLKEFVLTGDFNAPRGREIFNRIAEVYKDNIPKEITTTIDKKFHYAGDLQLVIDGIFTTNGYIAQDVRIVDGVSDHMAIIANITKNIYNG